MAALSDVFWADAFLPTAAGTAASGVTASERASSEGASAHAASASAKRAAEYSSGCERAVVAFAFDFKSFLGVVATVAAIIYVHALALAACGGRAQYAAVRQAHGAGMAARTLYETCGTVDIWVDVGLGTLRAVPHIIVHRVEPLLEVLRGER